MVDTGVSDRSPNWQGAVAHSGFQGSLADRLAHHEARVSDLRRAHGLLDQPPVAGGTMLAWKVLHDVVQRNQLRPSEARPYGAG
jgi:hypothetical protein